MQEQEDWRWGKSARRVSRAEVRRTVLARRRRLMVQREHGRGCSQGARLRRGEDRRRWCKGRGEHGGCWSRCRSPLGEVRPPPRDWRSPSRTPPAPGLTFLVANAPLHHSSGLITPLNSARCSKLKRETRREGARSIGTGTGASLRIGCHGSGKVKSSWHKVQAAWKCVLSHSRPLPINVCL